MPNIMSAVSKYLLEHANPNYQDLAQQLFSIITHQDGDPSELKRILNVGGRQALDIADLSGNTILHCAARNQYDDSIALIMEMAIDKTIINQQNDKGDTVLHIAMQNSDKATINTLLQYDVDLCITNNQGDMPLHIAIKNRDYEILRNYLLPRLDTTSWFIHNEALFELGVTIEDKHIINQLCAYGISLASPDLKCVQKRYYQQIALYYAILVSKADIVRDLIVQGVDVNDKAVVYSQTPLYYATAVNNLNIMKILVEADADVSVSEGKRMPPLYVAVEQDNQESVEYFLEKGAKAEGNLYYNPLSCAAQNNYIELVALLLKQNLGYKRHFIITEALNATSKNGRLEVIKMIYDAAKGLQQTLGEKRRPIIYASRYGHVNIVQWYLEVEPDLLYEEYLLQAAIKQDEAMVVKCLLDKERTLLEENRLRSDFALATTESLDFATQYNAVKSMYWLLRYHPELIQCKEGEYTPLHRAAKLGHVESVNLLVKYGAALGARNKEGKTPLMLALENSHLDVVPMLIQWDFNKMHEVFGLPKDIAHIDWLSFFQTKDDEVDRVKKWLLYMDIDTSRLLIHYLIDEGFCESIKAYLKNQLKRYKLQCVLNTISHDENQFKDFKTYQQQLLDVGMQLLECRNKNILVLANLDIPQLARPNFFTKLPIEIQAQISYGANLRAIWRLHPFQAYQPREVAEKYMVSLLTAFRQFKQYNTLFSNANRDAEVDYPVRKMTY